jgi:putative flippase GtrA
MSAGTYVMVATILARICSATYNFIINYKVVFKSQQNVKKALARYLVLAVVQMSLSALLMKLIYPMVGGLEVWVKIPVDVFLFLVNYIVQKKIIY